MVRTSRFCKDAKDGKYMKCLFDDCRTLYEAFRRGAKESSMTLSYSSVKYMTWQEGYLTLTALSSNR